MDNYIKEAALYEKIAKDRVRCNLCAHHCVITDGKLGVCHVRKNLSGKLYTQVYGRTISQHVDPIVTKPAFHLYPVQVLIPSPLLGATSAAVGVRIGTLLKCRASRA